MSRQQKTLEAKRRAEVEKKEILLKKAEEAGLLFQNEEIPPDEVDRKDVDKGPITSLLSMIPYTNAWYEANAAEHEMDDLSKIRIEKFKAESLLARVNMGQHEEVLSEMRAETSHDLFYFNKIKDQWEKEGKFKFNEPILNPFEKLAKGTTRNRIRKAHNMHFAVLESTPLLTVKSLSAGPSHQHDKNAPCSWRGKNKEGEFLQCTNARFLHPLKKFKFPDGKEEPEVQLNCHFHTPNCIGDHGNDVIKITIPNAEGLCSECYMQKMKAKPPMLKLESVPGVCPITIFAGRSEEETEEEKRMAEFLRNLNEHSICCWKPKSIEQRGYECKNNILKNKQTGDFIPYCGYHVTNCILPHESGSGTITIPNPYGLCTMHYAAEFGQEPPPCSFPFPGMKLKKLKNAWKIKPGHWGAPNWKSSDDIEVEKYEPPEPPADFVQKLILQANIQKYKWRVRKMGHQCATTIQRTFRGYRCRNAYLDRKYEKRVRVRVLACIRIQSQMRRFLEQRKVKKRKELFNSSALRIQKRYRGFFTRLGLFFHKKAVRIQRFMKKLRVLKFKDIVVMSMQLRSMVMRKMNAATTIQRIYRGCAARYALFVERYVIIIQRNSAKKIQKCIRRYLYLKHLIVPVKVVPGEDWALNQCAKRIAKMLWVLYCDREKRRQLAMLMEKSAPQIQRLIRGFIGRHAVGRVKFIRQALRKWCEPAHAQEFMTKLLDSKIFYKKLRTVEERPPPMKYVEVFRSHLPSQFHSAIFVDRSIAEAAITSWFESRQIPLLTTELESILKRFKNPASGKINMIDLDVYANMQKLPCRKHGRNICGDCYFYGGCTAANCNCRLCLFSGTAHSLCSQCNHAPTLHQIYPLEMKSSNKKNLSLIHRMNQDKVPDLSTSAKVTGIDYVESVIPPSDSMVVRSQLFETIKKEKLSLTASFSTEVLGDMNKSLSYGLIEGNEVAAIHQYWNENYDSRSLMTQDMQTPLSISTASTHLKPFTDLSTDEFWRMVPELPNKRVRDYHEEFHHSIPVPIAHEGQIRYTLEGDKIYFNILLELIKLEGNIHPDNPNLLRLIMDHIQIFERHWRKMVADVRHGQVNRHLTVAEEIKNAFQAINLPRPAMAKQLDDTFRSLGFHKKVLGKDIVMKPYATKKKKSMVKSNEGASRDGTVKSNVKLLAPLKVRRPSLPTSQVFSEIELAMPVFEENRLGSRLGKPLPTEGYSRGSPTRNVSTASRDVSSASDTTNQLSGSTMKKKEVSFANSTANEGPGPSKEKKGIISRAKDFEESLLCGTCCSPSLSSVRLPHLATPSTSSQRISSSKSSVKPSSSSGSKTLSKTMAATASADSLLRVSQALHPQNLNELKEIEKIQSNRGVTRQASRQLSTTSSLLADSLPPTASSMLSSVAPSSFQPPVRRGSEGDILNLFLSNSTPSANAVPLVSLNSRSESIEVKTVGDTLGTVNAAADVNQSWYDHVTAARRDYSQAFYTGSSRRFFCSFPGCGQSFPRAEGVFEHLSTVHAHHHRLAIANPLIDGYLQYYWPSQVPWQSQPHFKRREWGPGDYPCSQEGCHQVFPSKESLEIHCRAIHFLAGVSSLDRGYFVMLDDDDDDEEEEKNVNEENRRSKTKGSKPQPKRCPPADPPHFAPAFRCCTDHILPNGSCGTCVEVDRLKNQPKPPIQFYPRGMIDLRKKDEEKWKLMTFSSQEEDRTAEEYCILMEIASRVQSKMAQMSNNADGSSVVSTVAFPITCVFVIAGGYKDAKSLTVGAGGRWKARVVALATDRKRDGWVGIRRLYGISEAEIQRIAVPKDADRNFELFENVEQPPTWIPMVDIVGKFLLYEMEKKEFFSKRKSKEIPVGSCFFLRK